VSSRAVLVQIYDQLTGDACLMPLLDVADDSTIHGSIDKCDQPITSEYGRPVRRFEQGWPGDFSKAVVGFGSISRAPFDIAAPRGIETWTFRVQGWSQDPIEHNGASRAGDVHLYEILDHVIRILGQEKTRLACGSDILIVRKDHDGTVLPVEFDDPKGIWTFQEQFRWVVASRGTVAPLESCPCP
jgi:hypothetical protein